MINLHAETCRRIDTIAYGGEQQADRPVATAVATLAHEAMHAASIHSEGIAECYAMQLTRMTARELGTDAAHADQISELHAHYNNDDRAGTKYDSPDCYAGGPLDLELS